MLTYNIRVYGIVQGVGFRPFVSRTCKENGITGTVANKGSYVEIFAQGENVELLFHALKHTPPDRAVILNIISNECELPEFGSFEIIESEKDEGDIFVSPDIAICEECKRELFDPSNRRYMHPFINCTNCGPRLTILESMPYDRERTSMKDFEMCPECEFEYTHPETRRYDAQPVCCPDCGPSVYLIYTGLSGKPEEGLAVDREVRPGMEQTESQGMEQTESQGVSGTGKPGISQNEDRIIARNGDAITAARRALTEGKIVAIKGIGGFHLACDAKNEEAVARLRMLKSRPMKPFAVMMKNVDAVQRECIFREEDMDPEYLTSYQKPILLLEKKGGGALAPSVAPDNPYVGVMLPYTPLHMLIFDYIDEYQVSDCLVMTSANVSGAPICRTDEDALSEISGFTDFILSNDRMIRTRADDSVMDIYKGKPYMIRRSRGFAPLPVMISGENKGCVLAVGGELKNTFAIAKDNLIYPSAYVGDMEDIRTVNALEESILRMETLLEAKPAKVVCDMHPKYNTTAVAEALGLPVMKVQHHYAHILACMAENDYMGEVIGVSFDGTGYGTDGTIWGGEFLRCGVTGFERLDHISPFVQCGGDLSSKEGWRIAASILSGAGLETERTLAAGSDLTAGGVSAKSGLLVDGGGLTDHGSAIRDKLFDREDICGRLGICSEMELSLLENMARTGVNSIRSTSAGRLFDAVSAILGVRRSSTFEGEASTALMFEAERYLKKENRSVEDYIKSCRITDYDEVRFDDTNRLAAYIAGEYLKGAGRDELAFRFHLKLAEYIAETCERLCSETGLGTTALSGGVFQNKLLLGLVDGKLSKAGIRVLRHSLIPPNDGGICVGQALAGIYAE